MSSTSASSRAATSARKLASAEVRAVLLSGGAKVEATPSDADVLLVAEPELSGDVPRGAARRR